METHTPAAKLIGLMGPFGLGNLGDAATQQAVIENIRRYCPESRITGFSLSPEDTERRHGIPSFPISRVSQRRWLKPTSNPLYLFTLDKLAARFRDHPNRLVRTSAKLLLALPLELLSIHDASRAVCGMDLFVVSGGGQLDDYWGGPWHHPYTILVWSLIARWRKARLCFVSVGAGPLDHLLSRWFVRAALALSHYRSFRDQDSCNLVAAIGGRNLGPVFPDLAHSLEIDGFQSSANPGRQRPLVGVGPMAYFDPRVWPERDQDIYRRYIDKLAAVMVWLLETGHDVLLYPGEVVQDVRVICDVRDLLAERGIARSDPRVSAPPIASVDDLMAQLARVDLAIASRFHGVLLAQLLNKPVLALSYHPKIDHLMADMGQAHYCLPIDRFEPEEAKARFVAMQADQAAIKAAMAERTRAYREALDAQYRQIFGSGEP